MKSNSLFTLGLALPSVTPEQLSSLVNIIVTYVPLLTLAMTVFLAWYVNYVLRKRIYHEELNEKRLRDLYRPMDMALRASKSAFQRYSGAVGEEKVFIADLWRKYNDYMKELLMKNSYLMVEPEIPAHVGKLLEHIDVYLFDYEQYKAGKKTDPFPAMRGYPFPTEVNEYFASTSRRLSEQIAGRHRLTHWLFKRVRHDTPSE